MKIELKQFQERALNELRKCCHMATGMYSVYGKNQIISFTAPTGAGKTIILSALLEAIYFGDQNYPAQPNSVTIWLSDDPELNAQSKEKIETRADKFPFGQCVVISDANFDQDVLDDGKIYFLNTQKLSVSSNLTKHSDTRTYTIWETLENTIREKGSRLYFVIDEAHRGAKGSEAGKATTIMQKFIFGDPNVGLSKMPVVIGMSATVSRFNHLVGNTDSTVNRYEVSTDDVRRSGLLKDKITIAYPEEQIANKDMAVLQAATEEWIDKWNRWTQYCQEQHYRYVNPIMLVQVENGRGNNISETNLADCIAKIENKLGRRFRNGEVVHSFGAPKSPIIIGNLKIPYMEPSRIADASEVKIVFFKDALSTGWDCPRAETMMSFRHANDSTYIAQLLGRMIRTPLQMRIQVDETLNEVKLFLPHFNQSTVEDVASKLRDIEGGELPSEIESSGLHSSGFQTLSVRHIHNGHSSTPQQVNSPEGIVSPIEIAGTNVDNSELIPTNNASGSIPSYFTSYEEDLSPTQITREEDNHEIAPSEATEATEENNETFIVAPSIQSNCGITSIDRTTILDFINAQGFPTYGVRKTKVNNYLKSLFDLARLLSQSGINFTAAKNAKEEAISLISDYIRILKMRGEYEDLVHKVKEFRLAQNTFDATGERIDNNISKSLFSTTDSDIDRQFNVSEAKLGNNGIGADYRNTNSCPGDELDAMIDVIIFTSDTHQLEQLQDWAKVKFHQLKDDHRFDIVNADLRVREKYEKIAKDGDAVSELIWNLPYDIVIPTDRDGELFTDHLYVDNDGNSRFKLNNWEKAVLEEERQRPDFVCWLRNVDRKPWALCIPYKLDNEDRPKYPDFIIVRKHGNGFILDVLEPHSDQFTDNLAIAKGLASYAVHAPQFGRIQMIRIVDGPGNTKRLLRLDLTNSLLREKILHANTNEELNNLFNVFTI